MLPYAPETLHNPLVAGSIPAGPTDQNGERGTRAREGPGTRRPGQRPRAGPAGATARPDRAGTGARRKARKPGAKGRGQGTRRAGHTHPPIKTRRGDDAQPGRHEGRRQAPTFAHVAA